MYEDVVIQRSSCHYLLLTECQGTSEGNPLMSVIPLLPQAWQDLGQ